MTLFADETYALLAPLEDEDAAHGYALRALVRAIGSMFAQTEEAIRPLGDGRGAWERVFDPDLAPTWLLPFIGQAVGVLVNTSLTREEQIARIKEEGPWKRGGAAAIIRAAQATLYSEMNLIANPGFEHGSSGWFASGELIVAGSTSNTSAQAHVGSTGMKVVTTASAKQGLEATISNTFVAGSNYVASVWVKGNAGGEKVKLGVCGPAKADTVEKELTLTTSWQRLSVVWTPTANRTSASVAIFGAAASAITFFFDDVMLSPNTKGELTTWASGDSTGWAWLGNPGESTSVNTATAGAKRVRLIERNSTAWTLLAIVSPQETPSITRTREAIQAAVPGGIVVTVELSDLPLIDESSREINAATSGTIDTATLAQVT